MKKLKFRSAAIFILLFAFMSCADSDSSSEKNGDDGSQNLNEADIIFSDDFESGDLFLNESKWTEKASVSITKTKDGNSVADFTFKGSSDLADDAMSELRFDLGKLYTEIWIRFDLYIPSNYEHRDGVSTDNNKFFRMWPETYNDAEKVGASLMRNNDEIGGSSMAIDYSKQADWGLSLAAGGIVQRFITDADLGKWMEVKLYVKTSEGDSPAHIAIFKNRELFIEKQVALDYNPDVNGLRYGYLLGWSNSGFNEDTHLYIDNIYFTTKDPD